MKEEHHRIERFLGDAALGVRPPFRSTFTADDAPVDAGEVRFH